MGTSDVKEGWGEPALSKRAHYFRDARSLCMKWMFTGLLVAEDGTRTNGECAVCRKRLLTMRPRHERR